MSEVEQLAREQFKNTFRNRLCEMLSEIEEEYISAFIQGYAKGETDEKFRTKEENNYLSKQIQKLKIELDTPESVVLDKLDEAKDLLKRFIETNEPVYFDEDRQRFRKLKIEAEQFLKECE